MNVFLSAEVQNDVNDALRQAENKVRNLILPQLAPDYGSDVVRWTHITILRKKIPEGWGEVVNYHRKERVAEFRLIIDYETFKAATAVRQAQMLLESILRSLELFSTLNVKGFAVDRFRSDLVAAAVASGLIARSYLSTAPSSN